MTEATSSKQTEPQNDQSDDSMNITANEDRGTSEQAVNEVPIASTSKDGTQPDSTCKSEPQTSSGRGPCYRQLFNDTNKDGSNDPYDLLTFSDDDITDKDGSASSDNSESNHDADSDNDEVNTDIGNETVMKKNVGINVMKETESKKPQKMVIDDNIDSSDEEDCVLSKLASNDGGETSKTKDASIVPEEKKPDLSSSYGDTNYILSQVKTTSHYGGECSKTKNESEKEENESSSDEDTNDSSSSEQTTYQKSNDEGTENISSHAESTDGNESTKTEVVLPTSSNEGQAQPKPPLRNKAERKLNYTVPFKKFKKF
ncbi:PREDICTED: uncharacterized lipoprotein SSP0535-like [Papilio xuthus]|uniref:Uncharacterized lipoprotein SSP0535-like n=1 Tax=Papilio xuthus TaxID=66420 RepID=A0AAJ7EB58_PAPXU|nr:PREDICTED: uncharacterized lipoprotein SSP0535-like [Papilio xuthus]